MSKLQASIFFSFLTTNFTRYGIMPGCPAVNHHDHHHDDHHDDQDDDDHDHHRHHMKINMRTSQQKAGILVPKKFTDASPELC